MSAENAVLDAEVLDLDELQRLAELPALEYERERTQAAEKLGCRVGKLDSLVK